MTITEILALGQLKKIFQNERTRIMDFNKNNTAVLVTDPQNDFLSEEGATLGLVGESVKENKTIENIESLFKAARSQSSRVG